jgi:hypothetical protein
MYSMVKTFESFDGRERVSISRRPDGTYTYQRQWRSVALPNNVPDSPVTNASSEQKEARGPPGLAVEYLEFFCKYWSVLGKSNYCRADEMGARIGRVKSRTC